MSGETVVYAASTTSSAELVGSAAGRVRGIYVRAAGTAGTLVLKDGGSGGTAIVTVNTPAAVGGIYLDVPDEGVPFGTDLYATLTTADACTVFYSLDRTL